MTPQEYQKLLDKRVKDVKIFTDSLKVAAYTTTAEIGGRIFDTGRTSDGTVIGDYSEEPIYVASTAVPKPRGAMTGKRGKSKFKDGKKHTSKYFVQGYKGYRENVGRQTAFVDLSLTGELRLDFGNDKTVAEPRKVSDEEYQIRLDKTINQEKRKGLENKYGTVFTPSDSEKALFHTTMEFEFRNRFAKTLTRK